MEELKRDLEDIKELKCNIKSCLKNELNCGINDQNVQQIGLVVDMLKDFAEAEKCCAEAKYYKSICEAMDEMKDDGYSGSERMGYDYYRYSNGRFAPKGHGTRRGFHDGKSPYYSIDDAYDPSDMMEDDIRMRMGYDNQGGGNRSQSGSNYGSRQSTSRSSMSSSGSGRSQSGSSRYGYNYDRYDDARRNFSETKDPHHKEEMTQEALHHVKGFKESLMDIWSSSDPELKQKLKSEMSSLVNELKV